MPSHIRIYVNYIILSRNCVTVPSTNGLTFKLLKFIHHVNAKSNGLWNTIPFAYKALQAEDKIGTMLPCNVIVQEKVAGQVEVSAGYQHPVTTNRDFSSQFILQPDMEWKSNQYKMSNMQ